MSIKWGGPWFEPGFATSPRKRDIREWGASKLRWNKDAWFAMTIIKLSPGVYAWMVEDRKSKVYQDGESKSLAKAKKAVLRELRIQVNWAIDSEKAKYRGLEMQGKYLKRLEKLKKEIRKR